MIFSSPLFLFLFLPVVLTGYFFIPRFLKNSFLLFSSLLFYFWDERKYGLVMVLSIIVNYFAVILINRFRPDEKKKKIILVTALIFNIGLLVYFKYLNFIIINLNKFLDFPDELLTWSATIHLAVGISFFTFQAISFVVDVYRKESPPKNPIDSGLYIALFPQLIAGPIVRYNTIAAEIVRRSMTIEAFSYGIKRFILGLSKKVIIANTLGSLVDKIFSVSPNNLDAETAWLGIICYTLQLYFDFSGYSDMAIGLGKMFGFNFMENFNYPYISQSITEFWRRWHMSLSSWFKDYLYIPLGGSRKGRFRTILNLFIVFLLCGIWHGASWNFVVWGIWHGYFLIIERLWVGEFLSKLYRPFRHIYALLVIVIGWVFFRAHNLSFAIDYLEAMFGLSRPGAFAQAFYTENIIAIALIAGIIFSLPIPKIAESIKLKYINNKYINLISTLSYSVVLIALLALTTMILATNTYNPFIYYRF